jgi:hypothetical protein
MRIGKIFQVIGLILIFFIYTTAFSKELPEYKYINKPLPIIKGKDVDDVIIDLFNIETLLPPKYQRKYKYAPPPKKDKILKSFVFVFIFFDVEKDKRILEYIKRYETDFLKGSKNNVIIVLINTNTDISINDLREKVIDIENSDQGIYVMNSSRIYNVMFQVKKYRPLVIISKYNPEVKSPIEKPTSKLVVRKVLVKDFTFDDLIDAINSVLKVN